MLDPWRLPASRTLVAGGLAVAVALAPTGAAGPAGAVGSAGAGGPGRAAETRPPALATAISADGGVVGFVEVQTGSDLVPYFAHYVRDRDGGRTIPVGNRVPAYLGIGPGAAISGDGRWVTANVLAAGAPMQLDVYDLWWQRYEPISVDPDGRPANDITTDPSISADGRYVAFTSDASNLVAGDSNGGSDVFVRDRTNGVTRRLTGGHAGSFRPSISADGRYVAFASDADDVVDGDTNEHRDVFVRDLRFGTTHRISLGSHGQQARGDSDMPAISADGRYVAFLSTASDLVRGDSNGEADVFVRDLRYGTTHRISLGSHSRQANGPSYALSISGDGRYVAFSSDATNLVPGDGNDLPDVFVRDLRFGITRLASLKAGGQPSSGLAGTPLLSADGRALAYSTDGVDIVRGHRPDALDVFARDLWTHTNYWINQDTGSR
jgi:Tol biopolymer transport system component